MSDPRPIGVFDSGLGGLSVLREIGARLPQESMLYVADSGYAPYGEKSQDFIRERSLKIAAFLLEQGAKALVLACNTATAAAAATLRERWPDVPLIAMEPAVKPAAAATRGGVVGVLATTGTLASARFAALLDNFAHDVKVVTRPGVGLVEFVERGDFDSPALRALLHSHLQPLLDDGADVVVLGCTHYVFLREQVEAIVGPSVAVIDTGGAVAAHLQRRLLSADLLAPTTQVAAPLRVWTSGDPQQTAQSIASLLGSTPAIETLPDAL